MGHVAEAWIWIGQVGAQRQAGPQLDKAALWPEALSCSLVLWPAPPFSWNCNRGLSLWKAARMRRPTAVLVVQTQMASFSTFLL